MTDFRALCAKVLAYNEGQGAYNFSHLNAYDRDNAAFDAWQDIKDELKSALAQPEPEGPSIEDVEELCEEHCFNVEGYESIECLQGLINEAIARWGHQPAPPADGEVAECAALRAAADQVVPETVKPDDTFCCPPVETIVWKRLMNVRQHLLAIAAELEGYHTSENDY